MLTFVNGALVVVVVVVKKTRSYTNAGYRKIRYSQENMNYFCEPREVKSQKRKEVAVNNC